LALNSSDYCGSWAGLHEIDDTEYDDFATQVAAKKLPKGAEILGRLDKLRIFDTARISPRQIEMFRVLASKAATESTTADRRTLLLATLQQLIGRVDGGCSARVKSDNRAFRKVSVSMAETNCAKWRRESVPVGLTGISYSGYRFPPERRAGFSSIIAIFAA
jgi:hypothetical protein